MGVCVCAGTCMSTPFLFKWGRVRGIWEEVEELEPHALDHQGVIGHNVEISDLDIKLLVSKMCNIIII